MDTVQTSCIDIERILCMIGRALHMASNGTTFGMVIPLPLVMSTISLVTLSHSKHWISDPNVKLTVRWTRPTPRQALLPNPKGINLYGSHSPISNLSSLKLVVSSHNSGSLCMAHALTNKIVSRGISYPPIVQSLEEKWGTKKGAAGYNR